MLQPVLSEGGVSSSSGRSSRRVDSVSYRGGDEAGRATFRQATQPHLSQAHKLTQDLVYTAVRDTAERLGLASGRATLLDCGTGTSLQPVQYALGAIEDYRLDMHADKPGFPNLDVLVYHNDLPSFDWPGLCEMLNDAEQTYSRIPEPKAGTDAQAEDPLYGLHIFPTEVAGSFHRRLLPAASVHIALCFQALQWLSRTPTLPSRQSILTFSYKAEPEVHAAAFAEAKEDWECALHARAAEVTSGGTLIISVPGMPAPEELEALREQMAGEVPPMMLPTVIDRAFDDLLAEGVLDSEDLCNMNFPAFMPTSAELKAILDGVNQLWSPHGFCDLTKKSRFAAAAACEPLTGMPVGNWAIHPAWGAYQAGKMTAAQLGATYANALREKADLFAVGLADSKRAKTGTADPEDPEIKATVSKIFQALQDSVERDPVPMALYLFVGYLTRK